MDNQTLITDLILKAGLSKIRSGVLHATQKAKINTIEDLMKYSIEDLLKVRNLGKGGINELYRLIGETPPFKEIQLITIKYV